MRYSPPVTPSLPTVLAFAVYLVTGGLTGCRRAETSRPDGGLVLAAAPDRSLTLDEYESKGVPSLSAPWSSSQYTLAAAALEVLATKEPTHLPRRRSKRSASLFDRLVARAHPEVTDAARPLGDRLGAVGAILTAGGKVLATYLNAHFSEPSLGHELSELHAFLVVTAGLCIPVLDEAASATPKTAPAWSKVEAGRAQAVLGTAQILEGTMIALADHSIYDDGDRLTMAESLVLAASTIVGAQPAARKASICEEMRAVAAKEPSSAAREAVTLARGKACGA